MSAMVSSKTINALFRRGVPQSLARELSCAGHTLSGLSQLSIGELEGLGFSESLAAAFRDGARPPIDAGVVFQLMHECRRTCCICRPRRTKSLVLHHVREWSKHHTHDPQYLVVLCNDCHAEAHTRRELGRNLTGDEILAHKAEWMRKVQADDARGLFNRRSKPELLGLEPIWDYFNHRRITQVARHLQIDPTALDSFKKLSGNAAIDATGAIDWTLVNGPNSRDLWFMYSGVIKNSDGVYAYFGDLITEIVAESNWIDIRSIWTLPQIKAIVNVGDLLVLTAAFRFRNNKTFDKRGPNQLRDGYYQKDRIRIEFKFDAWETTSTSSGGNLSGIWTSTLVGVVRSIDIEETKTKISVTCLAIGTGFAQSSQPTPDIAYVYDDDNKDEMLV